MAQEWQIDGPKVLDIGNENETVGKLKLGMVAGRVDIVTHDDSPTARLEVHQVSGQPSWKHRNSKPLINPHVPPASGARADAL